MKIVGIVLPVLLLLAAVAFLRYQYDDVAGRVATPSESSFPAIAATPLGSLLCGANGKQCDLPGLIQPLPLAGPASPSTIRSHRTTVLKRQRLQVARHSRGL